LLQLFFPAAAEAFTELESEGKELSSLALKGQAETRAATT
jgi:hypothetical protein